MEEKRIPLSDIYLYDQEKREELERKYICYDPDYGEFIFRNLGGIEHHVDTQRGLKWHLIVVGRKIYLISHSEISFISQPKGIKGWENHEKENKGFMEKCYSSRTIGAIGTYLTAEEYMKLSDWIKSTAYECHVFVSGKRRRDIYYEIATAFGKEGIQYTRLADTAGGVYTGVYTFRPVVELSPAMFLIINDEHDGSSPEKGIYIEPARGYDPSTFKISTSSNTKEAMIQEAREVMQSVKKQMDRLEEILSYLK